MANNYKLWCENTNSTMDYTTYVNDTQRQNGFQGGTPASSTRVNTALRQSSLITCALMNVLAPDDTTTNFRSSVSDVQTLINNSLTNLIKTTTVDEANKLNLGTNNSLSITTSSGSPSTTVSNLSIAIGPGAIAGNYVSSSTDEYNISIGQNTTAIKRFSTAIGQTAKAWESYSLAIGDVAQAFGNDSIALGHLATANGNNSTALGYDANTSTSDVRTMQLGATNLSTLRSAVQLSVVSDERDKTDINNITNALEFVKLLQPKTFVSNRRTDYINDADKSSDKFAQYGMCDYDKQAHASGTKKGTRRRSGLIAQNVLDALDKVYHTDNYANIVNDNFYDITDKPTDVENQYTITYESLIPFLISAIQEQQQLIDELKIKVATLEGDNV